MNNNAFSKNYNDIIKLVENDFSNLDIFFEKHFEQKNKKHKNPIIPIVKDYFSSKGKRIRSAMIFLLTRALKKDIAENTIKLALAEEFIHNATLIHDDIIDCSISRRGKKTLNFEHDSKLAVLAGDYLLTEAMQLLYSIGNEKAHEEIRRLHTQCLSDIICGELTQYFNRFKILTIEQYIEKSKAKTAKLFEAGLVSTCLKNNETQTTINEIKSFATNFGIAFQINNDLKNINSTERTSEDFENGDYSAPIIYYAQEKQLNEESIKNAPYILKKLSSTNAIENTEKLLKNYTTQAIENLAILEDNLYKQALIDLCKLLSN